jgi:AcrR family transcriptional regulator
MAPAESPGEGRRSRVAGGDPRRRARLVAAMGELVAEVGVSAIGVHHVCQRAGMSRRTFYDLYAHREDCFIDTLEQAYDGLLAQVEAAVTGAGAEWEDRAVAATQALVGTLDGDRVLARLCVISALGGDPAAVRLRQGALDRIVALLAGAPELGVSGELVLAGALGGVWELVHHRLTDAPEAAVADLAAAAVYLMLSPFVGRRRATALAGRGGATAYVTRWTPQAAPGDQPVLLVTELTRQTLTYLDTHAGARNIDIARAVDVRHESQISRHLRRLEHAGLLRRRREGRTNAWQLTEHGRQATRDLRPEPPPAP